MRPGTLGIEAGGEVMGFFKTRRSEPSARPQEKAEFGAATRCPQCNGLGFLDQIDLIDRIQFQHCVECGHEYTTSEADILAV